MGLVNLRPAEKYGERYTDQTVVGQEEGLIPTLYYGDLVDRKLFERSNEEIPNVYDYYNGSGKTVEFKFRQTQSNQFTH